MIGPAPKFTESEYFASEPFWRLEKDASEEDKRDLETFMNDEGHAELWKALHPEMTNPYYQWNGEVVDKGRGDGGPGSGNHGHKGVPGQVGGSAPGNGGRQPVTAKDISRTYKGPKDTKSIVEAQGFGGLPKLYGKKAFDEAVKKSKFIAQRTYSASSEEVLDAYRNMLYNGDFYVDCSVGGSQYGQGMYCAANYNGELTEGLQEEIAHYQELGKTRSTKIRDEEQIEKAVEVQFGRIREEIEYPHEIKKIIDNPNTGMPEKKITVLNNDDDLRAYLKEAIGKLGGDEIEENYGVPGNNLTAEKNVCDYVETITLEPDAKIITYDQIRSIQVDSGTPASVAYKRDYFTPTLEKLKNEGMKEDELLSLSYHLGLISEGDEDFEEKWDALSAISKDRYIEIGKKIRPMLPSLRKEWEQKVDENRDIDLGAFAAMLGYDAINAKGHGASGSYTVILNRTKTIFLDETMKEDSKDSKSSSTIFFQQGEDGVWYAIRGKEVIGWVKAFDAQNEARADGGPGSGNHNHKGVPGQVGGSAPSYNSASQITEKMKSERKAVSINRPTEEQLRKATSKLGLDAYFEIEAKHSEELDAAMESGDQTAYKAIKKKCQAEYDKMRESALKDLPSYMEEGYYVSAKNVDDETAEVFARQGFDSESGSFNLRGVASANKSDDVESIYLGKGFVKISEDEAKARFAAQYLGRKDEGTFGGLSKDDERTISLYTYATAANSALRKGEHSEQADKLKSIIDRTVSPERTVYRGLSGGDFTKAVMSKKVGDTFEDKGFMSTSYDKDVAKTFAGDNGAVLEIRVPKGYGKSIDVTSYSNKPDENEVLLNAGTSLRIVSKDGSHIVCEFADAESRDDGGPGSGNFGHKGREGEVGGSAPSDESPTTAADKPKKPVPVTKRRVNDTLTKIINSDKGYDERHKEVMDQLKKLPIGSKVATPAHWNDSGKSDVLVYDGDRWATKKSWENGGWSASTDELAHYFCSDEEVERPVVTSIASTPEEMAAYNEKQDKANWRRKATTWSDGGSFGDTMSIKMRKTDIDGCGVGTVVTGSDGKEYVKLDYTGEAKWYEKDREWVEADMRRIKSPTFTGDFFAINFGMNGVSQDECAKASEIYSSMPEEMHGMYEKVFRSTTFEPVPKGSDDCAHFDGRNGKVYFNTMSNARTIFHECAHAADLGALDYEYTLEGVGGKLHIRSASGYLDHFAGGSKAEEEDFEAMAKEFGFKTNGKGWFSDEYGDIEDDKVKFDLMHHYNKQCKKYDFPGFDCVSDAISALTLDYCIASLMYGGHDTSYWRRPYGGDIASSRSKEYWANFCELKATQSTEALDLLKKITPNMYAAAENAYKEVFGHEK